MGTWQDWETIKRSKHFEDPNYAWLSELKDNPELDEVNAVIVKRVLSKA